MGMAIKKNSKKEIIIEVGYLIFFSYYFAFMNLYDNGSEWLGWEKKKKTQTKK